MESLKALRRKGHKRRPTEATSSDGLRRYIYMELPPNHIRCLTILNITADAVICALSHHHITQAKYQALSYVWGSEDKPAKAIIREDGLLGKGSGFVPLTANLNTALRDLWASTDVNPKVFWIDQICIDQTGSEKNHQLALMGQIYVKATRVITYIRPADEDPSREIRGIRMLTSLSRQLEPFVEEHRRSEHHRSPQHFHHLIRTKFSPDIRCDVTDDEWTWLVEVCFSGWPMRLWMVQEQLLNKNNRPLLGVKLLTWGNIMLLPTLWALNLLPREPLDRYWQSCPYRSDASPVDFAWSAHLIWRRKEEDSHRSRTLERDLSHNFGWYGVLMCRDPRDRIYAILSISNERARLCLEVQYSMSPAEVFHKAAMYCLKAEPSPILLPLIGFFDNLSDPDAPSWAFSKPRDARIRPSMLPGSQFAVHPRSMSRLSYEFLFKDRILFAKGRILERVRQVVGPCYSKLVQVEASRDDLIELHLDLCDTFIKALPDRFSDVEEIASVVRAVIGHGHGEYTNGNTPTALHLYCFFKAIYHSIYQRLDEPLLEELDARMEARLKKFEARLKGLEETGRAMEHFLTANGIACLPFVEVMRENEKSICTKFNDHLCIRGRTICRLESGRICTIANPAYPGDVVAALEGSSTFIALRPTDRLPAAEFGPKYLLIGDAWVDGLMHGETYAELDPADDYNIYIV